jgi:hypothetical protein
MKRFIEGTDRGQSTLFPECLEDWIDENNPVRVIDVFVDELELAELGFDGVAPQATGRPAYHPSALLKPYIYGYLNRVQSSRRLEREADRAQLSHVAKQAKATLQAERLQAVADRGYFSGEEIVACENAGITVTLPKPMTSGILARGRFGKQDFRYVAEEDVYICPAGESLPYRYTNEEDGLILRRYWTNACQNCAIKQTCTSGKERRITRWEHEHVLEAVQRRLDEHPEKMRQRRETVEHPFGTIKARMGATHFLMKTLPRVASEMALHVLAYNLTRAMTIMGIQPLMAAIRAN